MVMADDTTQAARRLFAAAPVARLATVGPTGVPHLVPVVFAVEGDAIYTAVDGKPKTTQRLQRLTDIAADPAVCVLVDHYDDDWSQLWWVRADGAADVHEHGAAADLGRTLLSAKYPQYQTVSLDGPVIVVNVRRWLHWGVPEVPATPG
jgi:PPOX class probable F420-dependent enzyme